MPFLDLTIVVPVYARRTTLSRLIHHYQSFNCQIIVADSSPDEYPDTAAILKHPNIEYRRYPHWPYFQKLHDILKGIKTRYYIEAPDDDFLMRSGVEDTLAFLQGHPDFSAAMGQWGVFDVSDRVVYRAKYARNYLRSPKEITSLARPQERCERILDSFTAWTHCVQLTQCALETADRITSDHHLAELSFWDHLCAWTLAKHGNALILPVLYGVRSKEQAIAGDRILKQRVRLYPLKSFFKGSDPYLQRCGDRFIASLADQIEAPESWVRNLYLDFCERRSNAEDADRMTDAQYGISWCRSPELCQKSGCAMDSEKTQTPSMRLVPQSEEGLCLVRPKLQYPLYGPEHRSELDQIARLILQYPVDHDYTIQERLKNLKSNLKLRSRQLLSWKQSS